MFLTIPHDAVLQVVRDDPDAKLVEVAWDGRVYRVFRIDLEEGSTQIWP